MQAAKKRWRWQQKRMGRWHHTQPDYILAWKGNIRHLRRVAFRMPLVPDSDHCMIIATFHLRRIRLLTKYCRRQQCFPLRLPPGPHDRLTRNFEALRLTCKKPEPKCQQGNDWILDDTWTIISHRTMLCRTGRLCQKAAGTMQRRIWASLKTDPAAWTAQVCAAIKAKLAGGDVQEAFRYLKGWY
jgi:hypothetical protein